MSTRPAALSPAHHPSPAGCATDPACHFLGTLTNLTSLSLGGQALSHRGLEQLSRLQRLKDLTCHGSSGLHDGSMAPLAQLKQLTCLDLSDCSIKGHTLHQLAALDQLQHLTLHMPGPLESCEGLTQLASLQRLSLLSQNQSSQQLAPLGALTNLTSLALSDDCLLDLSCEAILRLPQLADLYAGSIDLPPGAWSSSRCPALTQLTLGNASSTLVNLLPLPELLDLDLDGGTADEEGLLCAALARQTSLTQLVMAAELDGGDVERLVAQMLELRSLAVGFADEATLGAFKAMAQLPHLQDIILYSVGAPWHMALLHQCNQLTRLVVVASPHVDTQLMAGFLCKPGMKEVVCSGCDKVAHQVLAAIANQCGGVKYEAR
jgi:hypothetical protein